MKQRPFHQCQENHHHHIDAELAAETHQDVTQSTQSFEGQEELLDDSGEMVPQNKILMVQPRKVSSMLSQMLQSITRVIPSAPMKQHPLQYLNHNKPLHNLSSDNPVKLSEEPSNSSNMRKSSIVSVYCQKSDITFVSSSDEFSLKVFQKDDHCMLLPSLQIEVVLSRKDTSEGNNTTGVATNSSKKSSKAHFQFQAPKINQNSEDHINDDDEGYELLVSGRQDDSQLTSAISKHSSILKAFEEGSTRQATKLLKSAYELFISLQNTLINFQR